ncbi:Metallo-dependent phosphatase [Daldinia vernicosa]|uniref:Metallo-dependent phosphatase n=1 Tax=Daldinia vernicosa TaxID=114800 RepID=UPI0020076111|nr:Metallo-dependent phosphatase [Daldinia vernicosa]KAI0853582.1 Metallo-dependent phosphatase [Daldinia vernicosa]
MTQDAQSQSQSQSQSHVSLTKPTLLASLPPSALPKPHGGSDSPRLIMIGDVHGQLDALDALLAKVGYSRARGDTVVFTGDMVNKGPNSGGVVDRAVEIGAYSVRGNHEDRVLRAWAEMQQADADMDTDTDTDTEAEGDAEAEGKKKKEKKKKHGHKHKQHKGKKEDRKTAKSLTSAQRSWLAARPVILRVGTISPYYGDVVVVHGGLVPGIALEKQDPQVVMNIRTLIMPSSSSFSPESLIDSSTDSSSHHPHLKPSEGREGHPWSKVWNALEKAKRKKTTTTTVVYGHDAKTGLSIRRYAFGLDSNCARGGELTALVFEPASPSTTTTISNPLSSDSNSNNDNNSDEDEGPEIAASEKLEQAKYGVTHRLVSVACRAR